MLMQLADKYNLPVIPRGAGSGTTGGALAVHGGIILSLVRMNKILEIDIKNQIGIVEPGVITGEFQQELRKHKLMYPPDPASLKFCTMGGNAAECAGGPSAVKYGVTKDSIIGLEIVLPNGEILSTGTRTEKGVVGYDLTRLFLGSEGTLGIITKIITRLLPLPQRKKTFLLQSESLQTITKLVSTILTENIRPCTLEYMDRTAIELVTGMLSQKIPKSIQAILIVEIDGSKNEVCEQSLQLQKLIANHPRCTLQQAETEQQVQEIWQARRSISPASFKLSSSKISEDVVVPRSKIPELVYYCEELATKLNITILTFGHAGDGNIHVNIMTDDNASQEREKGLAARKALFKRVLQINGTLSGEHGVGISKSDFIELELAPCSINIMRSLKTLFDPKNILNPGKIFPEG